mgnify:CR=1 FL=1
MDGVRRPVGDQPPEVYWRRRILVLGVVALIGVVIWFLVTSPRGSKDPSGPDATTSPTISPTVTTSLSPGTTLDASRPCADADVTITATPNPGTFAAGSLPVFDVAIAMEGFTPCKLTVTQENSELLITSGNDRIFSSLDCPNDATFTEREFILQADSPDEMFQVTWNRQRSAPGCATVTSTPGAGYYWAAITIQGIAAEPVQFVLE